MLKNRLKKILPAPLYQSLREKYVAGAGKFSRANLRRLAELHGTDKVYGHNYIEVYARHFEKFRKWPVTFLEIGVGGYDDPHAGGQSLRMWRDYFYNGKIHALDIFDKSPHQEPRIKIYQGSQADKHCLTSIHNETGDFDLIVDDGSHLNEHIITSFEILFPLLKRVESMLWKISRQPIGPVMEENRSQVLMRLPCIFSGSWQMV